MVIGRGLFRGSDLSGYLRARDGEIESHVRQNFGKADLGKSDAEIVSSLLSVAPVHPIAIDFESPIRHANEVRIRVQDLFTGTVEIDGVRTTRSFSFSGDPKLFELRPTRWSSSPHGLVDGQNVIIGIEGRNDPDALKSVLDREEQALREYVANSTSQIKDHNDRLPALIGEAVARRRTDLSTLDDLAERL